MQQSGNRRAAVVVAHIHLAGENRRERISTKDIDKDMDNSACHSGREVIPQRDKAHVIWWHAYISQNTNMQYIWRVISKLFITIRSVNKASHNMQSVVSPPHISAFSGEIIRHNQRGTVT